ncbi:DNA translocase FtsK [Thermus filiformis]|uniref:Cell division protein FtsK n=1 Tax=Thermus filiformis TaxID=276 RepID=A0A0D6XAC5_THEFI|nr:DNA translocase FtsK [Thermus filiformis]KIX84710.1 cell division protein FtsK [Thermus filiformis]
MAKGKARKQTPNRDLEALGLFLVSLGAFLLTGAFPNLTGAVGAWVHDLLYRPLGLLGYAPSLALLAAGGSLLLSRPPGRVLRHLGFLLLLLLSLLPFLGEALGGLGQAAKALLTERLGALAYLFSALLTLALLDLWAHRPPLKTLLQALKLGVEGVRRGRLWLKTLLLRGRLSALARLYPDHPALLALAKNLSPKELPKVEEALRAFIRERVADLEAAIRAEARPLEPELKALAQGLEKPLPGRGPLREALEERRAALLLEAQALWARLGRLSEPVRLPPSLSGLRRGLKERERRRALWAELSGLLEDLKERAQAFALWLPFLEKGEKVQAEALKALLTSRPPSAVPATPEEEPALPSLEVALEPSWEPPRAQEAPPAPEPEPEAEPAPQPPGPASTALALPTPDLLDPPAPQAKDGRSEEEARRLAQVIDETLREFGVEARVVGFARGPSVTRYEILPAPGEKISRIANLQNDLARALAAGSVRVEAPIPGKNVIGLEVPNARRELVRFSEALLSQSYQSAQALLPLILGKSIEGEVWVRDLAKMPHLLIAGSTGSGKSVAINTLIMSLLYKHLPTRLRFLMVDPKMVELTPYEGIPHLIRPVVTNPEEAAGVLLGAVGHMERRYRMMSQVGARNLEQYNQKVQAEGGEALPYVVIVVDELADLMITAPKEVEQAILRLAQMARATGMHLILATQRPSVDILTSLIKVNIPARMAFAVSSQFDSRTILDTQGAERLIGQGDFLFYQPGLAKPVRLQAPYLSEEEVHRVAGFLRGQSFEDRFAEAYAQDFEPPRTESAGPGEVDFSDPLLRKAAEIVVEEGYGSVSRLQRRLSIGHARAGKLMDALEAMGIVGPHQGSKPREVLVTKDQLKDYFGG